MAHIFKLLRDDAGSYNLNVDGDNLPRAFFYAPEDTVIIVRVIFNMVDNGMQPTTFGGIQAGIAGGLEVTQQDTEGNVLLDFLDGVPIRRNADFSRLAGRDAEIQRSPGADHLAVRWTIGAHGTGEPLRLWRGQRFVVAVRDNLSSLDSFRVVIQGQS